MIGVITGLRAEARCLSGLDLAVACSGARPGRARAEAARLLAEGAFGLVSFGLAGGLAPELRPGDLVLAEAVVLPDGRRLMTDAAWGAGLTAALAEAGVAAASRAGRRHRPPARHPRGEARAARGDRGGGRRHGEPRRRRSGERRREALHRGAGDQRCCRSGVARRRHPFPWPGRSDPACALIGVVTRPRSSPRWSGSASRPGAPSARCTGGARRRRSTPARRQMRIMSR